ncbi:hypothetical protein MVES_000796 [Malassezia vespertilionis]|uniref:STAS domain-containing protein n=2 Tax=Malassezia vespertilionis TaxID=2020962 RepID=A0A2N1JFD7_9BASI|nr:hypothetical protein MVES_000796 [Malassezia vespertilionis]
MEHAQPSSYTATSAIIREDTAELGELALTSEDESGISLATAEQDEDEQDTIYAVCASANSEAAGLGTMGTAKRANLATIPDMDEESWLREGERHTSYDAADFQYENPGRSIVPGDAAILAVSTKWSLLHRLRRSAAAASKSALTGDAAGEERLTWGDIGTACLAPVRQLHVVILGVLLNILDGVSYGMIMFPTSSSVFSDFGGDGVSMFFMTCIISQLVYTLGGSIFKGGNGSMMIEVVPFFHILVQGITRVVGESNGPAIIATTMVSFALSAVLTGLLFLVLGTLRLGALISYFPRHILVGCIGGVGVFLLETGFTVTARIEEEGGFKYDLARMHLLIANWTVTAQWALPLFFACFLNYITAKIHHPLVLPIYFLSIPVLFYAAAFGVFGASLEDLQKTGWVFDLGGASSDTAFYHYLTYFNLANTSLEALWATLPTQFALVFFGILHVPLNVPALGVSVNEDNVDTDRELIAHGISNIAAGFMGTVPNYLCYVNSVLFYRVGGGSRLSGLMLAGATALVMMLGPGMIGYLPVMVVGALIFVLGIDLVREALYDTIGRVSRLEYITIAVIVVVMTCSDFVVGSLVGIALACLFFVMQTSRQNVVRTIFNGHAARSTVRRHSTQRRFLDNIGRQTVVVKLQSSLFFGTINSLERLVRQMLDISAWGQNPIRFLVMDFTLVTSVDFSAAEMLTRIHRLLCNRQVCLVFCGINADGDVAAALRSVDLWADLTPDLDVFASLNEALEWTENEYLREVYTPSHGHVATHTEPPRDSLTEEHGGSPRNQHLREAAKDMPQMQCIARPHPEKMRSFSQDTSPERELHQRAVNVLETTLGPYTDGPAYEGVFDVLAKELQEMTLIKGTVLWEAGDAPDALYFIESGVLKARYVFIQDDYEINEAMLAGTITGELSFLAQQRRNTTVTVDKDAKVWRLDSESLHQIGRKNIHARSKIIQLLLCATADEHDCLMSYLVSRLT